MSEFDFDLEKMKRDQDEASDNRTLLTGLGSIGQSLISTPTAYELLKHTKMDRPDIAGNMNNIAKSVDDPTERQAKLYQAYKGAKEAEQIKNQSSDEAKMRDPNSTFSQYVRSRAKSEGHPVDDSMSAYDIKSNFYDPKKMDEIKAQADVDFKKQAEIAKLNHQYAAREKEADRKNAIDKLVLEKSLDEDKNLPQNVFQAATYGHRVEDANRQMDELMAKGYNPASKLTAAKNAITPNFLQSEDPKLMEQAQRNFVNAVLRRESGSAIAPSEFESANKQYFPQVGDEPSVLEQKRRNREVALAGLKAEGQKAWGRVGGNLDAQASSQKAYAPDVKNYAQTHGISLEAAQMIKDKRTGKTMIGGQ